MKVMYVRYVAKKTLGVMTGCSEVCEAWFHATCAGVKEEIFDAYKQMDNLHWICETKDPKNDDKNV